MPPGDGADVWQAAEERFGVLHALAQAIRSEGASRVGDAQNRLDLPFVAEDAEGTLASSRRVKHQPVRAEAPELIDELRKQAADHGFTHASAQNHPCGFAYEPLG